MLNVGRRFENAKIDQSAWPQQHAYDVVRMVNVCMHTSAKDQAYRHRALATRIFDVRRSGGQTEKCPNRQEGDEDLIRAHVMTRAFTST